MLFEQQLFFFTDTWEYIINLFALQFYQFLWNYILKGENKSFLFPISE